MSEQEKPSWLEDAERDKELTARELSALKVAFAAKIAHAERDWPKELAAAQAERDALADQLRVARELLELSDENIDHLITTAKIYDDTTSHIAALTRWKERVSETLARIGGK